MTALVIFGSKSDEETYVKIAEGLNKLGISYELRIASAHKTPEMVDEIMSGNYDLIIAGAGLAAHLPGVIAAKKTVPVLGVPCKGAYDGLDAFLSIAQMPPGIPVLCVDKENAVKEAKKILDRKDKVAVVGEGKAAQDAMKTLEELGISFEMGEAAEDAVNIMIIRLGEKVEERNELIIYCPVGEAKARDAVKAMNAAKHGLWVGVNRGDNAAIAAAEIIGKENELKEYRKGLAEKVMKADEEVRK